MGGIEGRKGSLLYWRGSNNSFGLRGVRRDQGVGEKKNKYDPPILSGNLKWGIISDRWSSVFSLPEKHSLFNVNLETAEVLHGAPNLMFTKFAKIDAHE